MTGSSMPAEARPVRRPANSLRRFSSAPSMRRRRSLTILSSLTVLTLFGYDREAALAGHHIGKAAMIVDREDQDRNAILARERHRRGIHHLEIAREHI